MYQAVDFGQRHLSPVHVSVKYACQYATGQTEGLLYVMSFVFDCQWPPQPTCISASRPLLSTSAHWENWALRFDNKSLMTCKSQGGDLFFAPPSGCCKTLCLFSTYIHGKVSFRLAQSRVLSSVVIPWCISASWGPARNILCFLSPFLNAEMSSFCLHFHCCFVSLDLYSLFLYKNEKWNTKYL